MNIILHGRTYTVTTETELHAFLLWYAMRAA